MKRDGWYLWKHGANHDKYKHPNKKDIIIIGRRGAEEIPTGTYKGICKIIGL